MRFFGRTSNIFAITFFAALEIDRHVGFENSKLPRIASSDVAKGISPHNKQYAITPSDL